MALEYTFTCSLPNGVHARPASAIEEIARPFVSAISIVNQRTGQVANAKSVLGIVAASIQLNDRCQVTVAGPDERSAFDTLAHFFDRQFPHSDDALLAVQLPAGERHLPPLLRPASAAIRPGIGAVPGIGQGRAVCVGGFAVPDAMATARPADAASEVARLDSALEALARRYDTRLDHAAGIEAAVLKAHRSIARDPEFRLQLLAAISGHGLAAAGAIAEAEAHFTAMLQATGSALLRERAIDIRDVCLQLLHAIYGDAVKRDDVRLTADSVCVADSLTPGQFLALDRRYLKGLVLVQGGTTSHTVILARSFGVPTVVGVTEPVHDWNEIVVDGNLGIVVTDLTDAVRRHYEMERRRLDARRLRLGRFAERPAATADGRRVEVAANIGTADEAAAAFAAGAEGIGLFRTEMLFVDRSEPPSEDEQFEQYRSVLCEARERPVIIRTLDVGGDKPVPYLQLPHEDNPFLGYRAVRFYPRFEAIFRSQVAALVRASAFGRLKVMVPMVARLEEIRWLREVVADEQARCQRAGLAIDPRMQVGAMVEVPSLALVLDHASRDLDFFSIGTNDLLQYLVAADRANRDVAYLYDPLHPGFLRLLKRIVDDARRHQRWVGLCGEMGGQIRYLPLLVGLGLDEISMAAPAVAPVKAEMASLSASACARLLDDALQCAASEEVSALLTRFGSSRAAPLLEPDLVVVDGDGRTKEEAIKEAVDTLYVAGRTERPHDIEEAVWRREEVYSTGFGYGFAIPHCKSDAVRTNSLVVVKLKSGVDWGSLDGNAVRTLLLLTIRESDPAAEHMKVLATLARKVMHEDFRERIEREQDPEALCRFLGDEIGGLIEPGGLR
jgi:fructose-specific PTS system IIA-like component